MLSRLLPSKGVGSMANTTLGKMQSTHWRKS